MMFDIANTKILHLEPSSICNAACPQCSRFATDGVTLAGHLTETNLTLDTIKEKLSVQFVANLNKMFACGSYGDPAANTEMIQIYDWFREINPKIELGMNTNGGLRNTKFWHELAKRLNRERDYCVFSIDGLEDTNHIYRRKTVWKKIMENVTAFISSGGRAHWDMLIFKHNQHQVDAARQLAKDMGFVAFRTKASRRHSTRPIDGLEPPDNYTPDFHNSGTIECQALIDNSLFMNHMGLLQPCCFVSHTKIPVSFFDKLISSWDTPTPFSACVNSCTVQNNKNNFQKQWVSQEYFL
jgi:sulfatase maturation enzyme AslB (radical SAM superfamily)